MQIVTTKQHNNNKKPKKAKKLSKNHKNCQENGFFNEEKCSLSSISFHFGNMRFTIFVVLQETQKYRITYTVQSTVTA